MRRTLLALAEAQLGPKHNIVVEFEVEFKRCIYESEVVVQELKWRQY